MSTANYNIVSVIYQRVLLAPLGLDRETSAAFWILVLFGSLTAGGLWYFNGEVPAVLAILYLTGIFILSMVRIDYSFYVLMAGVMLFEQHAIPGFTPVTHELKFFSNLKEISYIPYIEAGIMNVVEIHLAFILFSLLILVSAKKDFSLTAIPAWLPFTLFFVCLSFSFAYGIYRGGDVLVAIWEVRALYYLGLIYLITPQIIRTKKQIRIIIWIFIVGITVKAFQGIGRFIELGFTTGGYDVLTNHEDPVFMVTLFMMLLGFIVYRTGNKQCLWLIVFLIPLLLGFYVAQRRASYASLMVSVSVFIVLLPVLKRRGFMKLFLPVLTGLLIYGFVFWNHTGTLGRPAQMVKSGLTEPEIETNFRDYSSNLYREFENYNLAVTVQNNVITGTGFGQRYEQPIPLAEIIFPLREYIPHNQILWVLVKMGAVGFLAFWFFFNSFAARGAQVLSQLEDPWLKVIATVVTLAVINQVVVSFFDLQLTYYRNMLYLGCLMGLLPAIERSGTASPETEDSTVEKRSEEA